VELHHRAKAALTAAVIVQQTLRQVRIAADRHEAQTDADRQRRITESFSKAVEQLASEKIEMRLGGIYTLERICRESPNRYLPVMETLTAFVRERAYWKEPDQDTSATVARYYVHQRSQEPPTDIAAVLTVIARRPKTARSKDVVNGRALEKQENWHFDLRQTNLRRANLPCVHLEGAILTKANLEGAILSGAHLEDAKLAGSCLERASLAGAYLKGADLNCAHLEGTLLVSADLTDAILTGIDLSTAIGDDRTRLPNNVLRPANWSRASP
jgi:hypothetical protein